MNKTGKNILFVLGIAAVGLIVRFRPRTPKALPPAAEASGVTKTSAEKYIKERKNKRQKASHSS